MKIRLLVTVLAFVVFAGLSRAQEMPKPGPEHEKFKEMVGDWEATFKFGNMESKGSVKYSIDLGGFYLIEQFEGDFGGMKFKGHGQIGYCPIKKKHFTIWTDSMSPSPMYLAGNFDKEGKTLTQEGEGPGHDGKTMAKFKSVSTMADKDTMNFTLYMVADDKDTPMFSITYKRKK